MKKHTQQPNSTTIQTDNKQLPTVTINREGFNLVMQSAGAREQAKLCLTMGISVEENLELAQKGDHYQYGPSFHALVNDIITLTPKPKKFIVVVADYLHRHNLKVKSLLSLVNQQYTHLAHEEIIQKKQAALEYVIASAKNTLIGTDETQSIVPEPDQAIITNAAQQAATDSLNMGQLWLANHKEEASNIFQHNSIAYERHVWTEWYDSADAQYSAKVNIPETQELYCNNSTFKAKIDEMASKFLSRISWIPKKEELINLETILTIIQNFDSTNISVTLQQLAQDQFKKYTARSHQRIKAASQKTEFNDKEQREIQSIIRSVFKNLLQDLLKNSQYELLLDTDSLNSLTTLFRIKDHKLTPQDIAKSQAIFKNISRLFESVQNTIIATSKLYLIEEAAASKWFASLSEFSILTYKDATNPAFDYALECFGVKTKLPFVPYKLKSTKRIKPTQVDPSELTPEQSAARRPIAGKDQATLTTTMNQDNSQNTLINPVHAQQAMNPSMLSTSLLGAIIPNQNATRSQATSIDSSTTTLQDRMRSKSPSPDFQYNLITSTLEQENCTSEDAIEVVQLCIDQKMKNLTSDEIATQARAILRLVASHPNTPDELFDAVTTYLTSKGFIKQPAQSSSRTSPTPDTKPSTLQPQVTSVPQKNTPTPSGKSAAIPVRQPTQQQPSEYSASKHKRAPSGSPSSHHSPPSRLHSFFSRSSKRNRASSSGRDLQPLPSSRTRLVESRRSSYSSEESRYHPAVGA